MQNYNLPLENNPVKFLKVVVQNYLSTAESFYKKGNKNLSGFIIV